MCDSLLELSALTLHLGPGSTGRTGEPFPLKIDCYVVDGLMPVQQVY
jgi:hypothetical protein